jgi:putative flippase GtrA
MQLALQYLRFGAVGLVATLTHALLFVLLMETARIPALAANLAAFSMAVVVSFLGHFYWTFRETGGYGSSLFQQTNALLKFATVAVIGFSINSVAIFITVDVLLLSYYYAVVIMVGIVPPMVFVISKHWAFAEQRVGS